MPALWASQFETDGPSKPVTGIFTNHCRELKLPPSWFWLSFSWPIRDVRLSWERFPQFPEAWLPGFSQAWRIIQRFKYFLSRRATFQVHQEVPWNVLSNHPIPTDGWNAGIIIIMQCYFLAEKDIGFLTRGAKWRTAINHTRNSL